MKKLPNYLSLDEAKKMINVYANSKYELDIRDNAVIHLFLNSGLRLSELKKLSIDDLNLDTGKFSIIGKGNKERTGYINKMTKIYTHLHDQEVMDAMLDHPLSQYKMANEEAFCA